MRLADLTTGVTLGGKFKLVHILGRGSYGDVWLADVLDDDSLPKQVAVKVYYDQDRATRKLMEEATTAKSFQHERLVKVFGADRIDSLVVMWMEYVPGPTLLQRVGDESEPRTVALDDLLQWMVDMAEALAYLHVQDPPIVHGDLKLDNVLLEQNGRARLVDYGQSRTIEDRFVETKGVGAWPYLAPEIVGAGTDGHGKRYVGSDIYAFGVIVYRLLTGRFPRRTISEVFNLTPFPRPVELNSSVPNSIDAVVCKCLEKRPANRYAAGAALLVAVEQAKAELSEPVSAGLTAPFPTTLLPVRPAEELAAFSRRLLDEGKVDEAIHHLETVMQRTSTSPCVLLLYAEAARRAGKLEIAGLVYDRTVRWLRDNGASDEDLRSGMEGMAEVDIRLKRYEKSVEGFAWLSHRWPAKRWYRYRHGVSLGLAGRFRASAGILQKLYEDGPPSALVCGKIGLAYLQLRDEEQARQYFNEALMLDQYEPTSLFHLARLHGIKGHSEKAIEYLRRLEQVEGAEDQATELARCLGVQLRPREQANQ